MTNTVIQVENISKLYRLGVIGSSTIREDLSHWWNRMLGKEDVSGKIKTGNNNKEKDRDSYIWALKDINFEVKQGEVLGIIGKNGAGKSTLLKILSQITQPTSGEIRIKGRISSLLEVGTGFHPELSGRENIFLNGAILGMKKNEIKNKFDEIVDFSGVKKFIDTPVKRYSSGMYVRLAFAVAAHLEPDILIVDEVLAVGDAEFQKKCLGKMKDVAGTGRTVLFVSHNMAAMQNLCNRSILLKDGVIFNIGTPQDVIAQYLLLAPELVKIPLKTRSDRKGNGVVRFTDIVIIDDVTNEEISDVRSGSNVRFRLFFEINEAVLSGVLLGIGINDKHDQRIAFLSNEMLNQNVDLVRSDNGFVDVLINKLPLTLGRYDLTVFCSVKGEISDWIQNALYFNVSFGDYYNTGRKLPDGQGSFLMDYSFR